MYLVDMLHQHGIGVILDWVPSHFPDDAPRPRALRRHPPLRARRPAAAASIPSGRARSSTTAATRCARSSSRARCSGWSSYHIDGLRVDAVASMLYLDYGRKAGEWIPNAHGGKENLEAIEFLQQLNSAVVPRVSRHADRSPRNRPRGRGVAAGVRRRPRLRHEVEHGLDARHARLHRARPDPPQATTTTSSRSRIWYAFYGELRAAAVARRGGVRQGLAASPRCPATAGSSSPTCACCSAGCGRTRARSSLFMGGEFGQRREWDHERGARLGARARARPRRRCSAGSRDLNRAYRAEPALHERDFSREGFEWIDGNDADNSVLTFLRWPGDGPPVLVVCNFTPVVRDELSRRRAARRRAGARSLNSDAHAYGGSGIGNLGGVDGRGHRRGTAAATR